MLSVEKNRVLVLINKYLIEIKSVITVSKDLHIKNYLISKGRYGIPFNEIYNLKFKEGFLLPELLNKKQLINILNQ